MSRSRWGAFMALLLLVVGLFVAGCGGGGDEEAANGTGGDPTATREPGEKIGGSVEVIGAFGGDEAKAFEASLKEFEQDSGIDVKYTSTNNLNTVIRSRVQGNNPPDIALFPQPGLALDMAKANATVPIDEYLDADQLKETLIPGFLESTTINGKTYGAPMRMAVKSLLWYPTPEFKKAGYEFPETHQELVKLEDQIEADGETPLCLGYESGQETGWVGTDWLEEYMLRANGPEAYDKWVTHEIKFNSPEVKKAAELYEEVALKEGRVVGGRSAILSTPFGNAADPLFENPPECFLHRQGNFMIGLFPKKVQKDLESQVGVGYFPAVEGGFDGKPILGGGDIASLFTKSRENRAAVETMRFLSSPEFGGPWAKAGGWLSPHQTFDESQYKDDTTRKIAKLATDADVFRYDASDLMPASVGAGSFWRGMSEWTSGEKELDQVLTEIDESWPQ